MRYVPLPVGMGLADLHMDPVALPGAKTVVRSIVYEEWRSIAERVSRLSMLTGMQELLSPEYERTRMQLPDGVRR